MNTEQPPATDDQADNVPPPKPRGLLCPDCRGNALEVYGVKKPKPDLRVRYMKCVCGTRLRTSEKVTKHWRPATDAPTDK